MGGHGALVCALKSPGLYQTVSAFAPICNPMNCPWGIKAFSGYLGEDKDMWQQWDATCLVGNYQGPPLSIFVDQESIYCNFVDAKSNAECNYLSWIGERQGEEDQFLKDAQLLPDNLVDACVKVGMPITLRKQQGYDHSYFFIATFLEDHFDHHVKYLKA